MMRTRFYYEPGKVIGEAALYGITVRRNGGRIILSYEYAPSINTHGVREIDVSDAQARDLLAAIDSVSRGYSDKEIVK